VGVIGIHPSALKSIGSVLPVTGIRINGDGGDKMHTFGFCINILNGGRS
jgi:hypothetical protein